MLEPELVRIQAQYTAQWPCPALPRHRGTGCSFLQTPRKSQDSGWTPDTMFLFYIYTRLKLLAKNAPQNTHDQVDPVYITWCKLNMPIVSHGLSNQYFSLYKNVYIVDSKKTHMILCIFTYHL